jgi:hypothetical protein
MAEPREPRPEGPGLVISCDDCRMQGTDACRDCVVTFILDRRDGAVVFDAAEERALRALARAGLVPDVRWRRRRAAG